MDELWPDLLNLNEFKKSAISIEKSMKGREELRKKLVNRQQTRRRRSRKSKNKPSGQQELRSGSDSFSAGLYHLELEGNKLYEDLLEPENFGKIDAAKAQAVAKAPPEDLKNMLLSI
jgi:hypothetical protein